MERTFNARAQAALNIKGNIHSHTSGTKVHTRNVSALR